MLGKLDNQKTRHKFILTNLGLVTFIAKIYINRGIPLVDLIQEGSIGLIRAADKFDPSLGVKFSSYAVFWIKQGIRRLLLTAKNNSHISLNQEIFEDFTFLDLIEDSSPSPFERVDFSEMRINIKKSLDILPERERKIIELRFGLLDGNERNFEEIGKIFNLSRQRIFQIYSAVLEKLKQEVTVNLTLDTCII